MKQQFYVYVLEIKSNKEVFYVGKGKNLRYTSHRAAAKNNGKNHTYLYRKINKLWENGDDFTSRIVYWAESEDDALNREIELISIFGKENLCNLTDGGDGTSGYKYSEEGKQKLRERFEERREYRESMLIEQGMKTAKKVRRLDTRQIYDSLASAAKDINRAVSSLRKSIINKKPIAGIVFEFVNEENSKIDLFIPRKIKFRRPRIFIRRTDTGEIFQTVMEASRITDKCFASIIYYTDRQRSCDGIYFQYIDKSDINFDKMVALDSIACELRHLPTCLV